MAVLFYSLILALAVFVPSSYCEYFSQTTELPGDENPENELRTKLFYGSKIYNRLSRPVKKWTSAVPVFINISPLRVREMNERDQLLSLETWMKLRWTDEYLRWNPDEYDNITVLHLPPSDIWKPDIALYTGSPDTSLFPVPQTNAIVYHTGKVLWVPPFTINSRCPISSKNHANSARAFVECNIRLGSWTYSGKMVDLQLFNEKVDLTNFQDNNHDWKLVKIESNRQSKLYDCCPDEYPHVNFNITLKKRIS